MATQKIAQQEILSLWLSLPAKDRETENQAVIFSFKIIKDYPHLKYRTSGDIYQSIKNFLCNHLSK